MKPLTPIGSPSPLRLLNKGPEYLRRQMDSGSRGRSVSAVEQLEADKAKYVKSQQVINTKQEPVLVPCATPPPQPRRPFTVPHATTPLQPRKFSAPCASPSPLPRRSFILCDDDVFKDLDAKKENRSLLVHKNIRNIQVTPSVQSPPVLRRSTGKRMLRPDSLIIYRQKRECNTSSRDTKGNSFVKRLFQGSMREKHTPEKLVISEEKSPSKEEDSRMSWANEKESPKSDQSERELFVAPSTPQTSEKRDKETTDTGDESSNPATLRKTGLQRSKSELWLRYSLDLSEKEHFFSYCGLDLEIVDRIGLENFYTASSDTVSLLLRSASMGCSEPSEFSRRSGEGLFEEEVTEQSPTGVSVIERNARVIKWLYGCRNAKDTPKESTV